MRQLVAGVRIMGRIIAILRTFLALALPYFRLEERWRACALLGGIVAAELGLVFVAVAVIKWNGRFFNARKRGTGTASARNSSSSASSRSARSSSAWRNISSARRYR